MWKRMYPVSVAILQWLQRIEGDAYSCVKTGPVVIVEKTKTNWNDPFA